MKDEQGRNGAKNHLYALLRRTQAALEESEAKVQALEARLAELVEVKNDSLSACALEELDRNEDFLSQITNSEVVKKKIIEDYLRALSLKNSVAVLGSGLGSTPLTPPRRPKSLAEAKKLAEILIKG